MAYSLALPHALTTADRRSVEVYISDVRGNEEQGKVHTVHRFCPENYVSDGFIPPNLDFLNCYLHTNTKAMTAGGPSLKKLISSTTSRCRGDTNNSPQVVAGVVLKRSKLFHVLSTHSVMTSDSKNFISYRKKPIFQTLLQERK